MSLFRANYTVARSAFVESARRAGAKLSNQTGPLSGLDGESLTVDVAAFGHRGAAKIVFLTSGLHGVELSAGTQCQVDLLQSGRLSELPNDIAVVLIHAANPWGASFGRRYTEENVDLCRNFVSFPTSASAPAGYDDVEAAVDVEPSNIERVVDADGFLGDFAARNGVHALYNAIMAGQYRDADGIGFGGRDATWARRTLERIMLEHAGGAKRVVAIDYHTGVGPYAYGCIVAMQRGARLKHVERNYFGPWIMAPRENPPPGFIDVSGHTTDGYEALFPRADVIAGVLEFGTYPQSEFMRRLIAEHRWTRHHGGNPQRPELVAARRALLDFFIPDDKHWQDYVRHRGRQVFEQCMEGIRDAG